MSEGIRFEKCPKILNLDDLSPDCCKAGIEALSSPRGNEKSTFPGGGGGKTAKGLELLTRAVFSV